MTPAARTPVVSEEEILAFLQKTAPFNVLTSSALEQTMARMSVEHFPKGSCLLQGGRSEVTHLMIIFRGRVKLHLMGEEGQESLVDHRGPGETMGALGIFRGSRSNMTAETMEDTVCLLMRRDDFLALVETNARFAAYYLRFLSESYVGKAFTALRQSKGGGPAAVAPSEGSLYLFTAQVGDVVRRRPPTIAGSENVQRAAAMMNETRSGALLVSGADERIVGILTDRDLRNVVAKGGDASETVERVMSAPVSAVSFHTVCFDALIEMLRRKVHHLALERGGRIVGLVSGHDLMVAQGSSPFYLLKEILAAKAYDELYDLSRRAPLVVRSLIYEGAKASNVTRLITLLNDYILDRMLHLLTEELGPPPVPFCWLLMGSEGRKEQTFRTDQDNGLIYQDPVDQDQAKECESYFRYFGTMAIEHLVACGFPRCNGGIMASNPQWCQPYSIWQSYFDRWITTPEPKDVLNATIFFDFRAGWGELALGRQLREHLVEVGQNKDIFYRHLAKDCLTTPSPLTFFKNFVVEKKGEHKNKVDLKTKGLVPFVDFARLLALKSGIRETNTLERLQQLADKEVISRDLHLKAAQSYELQMQLRLIHQQRLDEEGLEPNNFVDPEDLSDLERHTLKDAFAVVGEIKSYLKDMFNLAQG